VCQRGINVSGADASTLYVAEVAIRDENTSIGDRPPQIARKNLLGDSENREGRSACAHCER